MQPTKPIYFNSNYTNINGDFKLSSKISSAIEDTLTNNNAVGACVGYYDENLTITYVSDFLLELLGYDPINLLNSDVNYSLLDFINTDDKHIFLDGTFYNQDGKYDFSLVDLDKNPRFVHAYKKTSADENGNPIWVMSIRASDDVKSLKVLNKMFESGLWRVSFDTDGDIYKVYFSDDFRHMIGFENEEDFPNHMANLLERVHPWDIDFLKYMFYTTIDDPTHEFEFKAQARIKNKNGNYVWYQFNSDVNWRPNGTIYEIIGVIVNINETKEAELESEHYKAFHEAYTASNLCEYYLNLETNTFDVLKLDDRMKDAFNDAKNWEDLVNTYINKYVVEVDRQALRLLYDKDYIINEFNNFTNELSQECCLVYKGQKFYIRNIIMKGRVDENGNLVNVMICLRDITDTKIAREEREALLSKNSNMNQLIQGMTRLVDKFVVIDLNEDKYNIYGIYEDMDIEGVYSTYVNSMDKDFETFSSNKPITHMFAIEHLRHHIQSENDIYAFEYANLGSGKIEHASFIPVEWKDGVLSKVLMIGMDVTREKRKELEAKQALKDALQAANNASESKSQFLSNMSHDIRTPMNAIIGMTAIAGAHIDEKERVKDCLGKISVSSRHLLSLINEVLDMSRIESGKVTLAEEEFNLPELVDNMVNIAMPGMKKHNHDFNIQINNIEHEDVFGDSLRIQQVFTNIISNAIKYTPDGGKISFTMSERPTHHENIGCYEFVIEDNGMGMSEDFVKVIFEPFSRSDDKRTSEIQGTGLGMAITKNIVNMMNGDIKVESKLHEGSKFTVTIFLKIHDKAHEIIDELTDLSVLIVDDDISVCEGTCTILKEIGMKPEYCTSGKEAIYKVVSSHRTHNDYFAVLIDLKMPELDGIETTKEIRRQIGNNEPTILLSSFDYADIETQARNAGVNGFLTKPLFKSRLTSTFKQLLDKDIVKKEVNDLEKMSNEDFSNKRILLVEDNELNREIAYEIISTTGCKIETAVNGKEALDLVNEKPDNYYDLIFMDIQMPIMNGYEAASAIRSLPNDKGKKMPIIAMTANAFAEDVVMAKNAGMNEHLAKPINIEKLREVMHTWLA